MLSEENGSKEQQSYILVKNWPRREIWPLRRYGYLDIAYCFIVAEEMEFGEPSNNKEAISSCEQ